MRGRWEEKQRENVSGLEEGEGRFHTRSDHARVKFITRVEIKSISHFTSTIRESLPPSNYACGARAVQLGDLG